MVHGGVCIAHAASPETLFVENAIPGELVEARLRFRGRGTWFAEIVRVIEPSPDRVTAPCPYVPHCGGCQLQHVAYARQLSLKREIVADALRRQGVAAPDAIRVHGMHEPWGYRVRGEFHVVRGDGGAGGVGLGFNRARSWIPIAVDDCLIHDRHITGALSRLRTVAARADATLRTLHVTAGEDGRELLVSGRPHKALASDGVDPDGADTEGPRLSTEWTTLRWRDRLYRVRSATFIQTNWEQMDVLYGCVIDALGEYTGARLVDAYAGIGVLACYLAAEAGEVVCIESSRESARTGVLNARVNGVSDRVLYMAGSVESALPSVASQGGVDAVILDPPRAGCDGRVTAWLALVGPRDVVYVSCDPATLARDLRILVASGPYELRSLDIVDMFPQTYHVECVAALRRA